MIKFILITSVQVHCRLLQVIMILNIIMIFNHDNDNSDNDIDNDMIKLITLGEASKKKLFFFGKTPKGGGRGLAEPKISLSEKNWDFLDFFFSKGGGLTYSKRVLS